MELYTLDSLYQRTNVIDRYQSMIWTERWAAWGDFELSIRSTFENRNLLKIGTMLGMSESYRIMIVETIEDSLDSEGNSNLTVKGRSLEKIFEDRVIAGATGSGDDWVVKYVNAPATMRFLFFGICINGTYSIYDTIDAKTSPHPKLPLSQIPAPPNMTEYSVSAQTLYSAFTHLSNTWEVGFRLIYDPDTLDLHFEAYMGNDRTSSQTTFSPVIFAPELDNLTNTNELHTIENSKNVAYVKSANDFKIVTLPDVPEDVEGIERRVIFVDANDIELPVGPVLTEALIQKGREALSEHREVRALDGEIRQHSQYKYNQHYYLGDVVEIRNTSGASNHMRVTEQIFVSDQEGDRMYPTLSVYNFVNVGSWLSFEPGRKWIDYDADTDTVWSALP